MSRSDIAVCIIIFIIHQILFTLPGEWCQTIDAIGSIVLIPQRLFPARIAFRFREYHSDIRFLSTPSFPPELEFPLPRVLTPCTGTLAPRFPYTSPCGISSPWVNNQGFSSRVSGCWELWRGRTKHLISYVWRAFVNGFIDIDEKAASSKTHAQLKTRVQKPYPFMTKMAKIDYQYGWMNIPFGIGLYKPI